MRAVRAPGARQLRTHKRADSRRPARAAENDEEYKDDHGDEDARDPDLLMPGTARIPGGGFPRRKGDKYACAGVPARGAPKPPGYVSAVLERGRERRVPGRPPKVDAGHGDDVAEARPS